MADFGDGIKSPIRVSLVYVIIRSVFSPQLAFCLELSHQDHHFLEDQEECRGSLTQKPL